MIVHSRLIKSSISVIRLCHRKMSDKGLVLGVYANSDESADKGKKDVSKFTSFGQKYNDKTSGELLKQINTAGIGANQTRIFYNIGEFPVVAVSGVGEDKWDALEGINGVNENVRNAACAGAKALQALKIKEIFVDSFDNAQSAAEGSQLGVFKYQELKNKSKQTLIPNIHLAPTSTSEDQTGWERGTILASAQNFARTLMDTPANLMTPTIFAETIKKRYQGIKNLEVIAHDEQWAKDQGMNLFLSVTHGSAEPAKFVEITYNGASKEIPTVALVGKGITFDTGGISIKGSAKMDQMRADMGGAANVASAIWALAELKANVNVKGFIPLCENMPGSRATKPGDVFIAKNGMTVCVDNTDAEGRLVLGDALCYAGEFNPKFILDIATLTGAIRVALGDCLTGAFTNNNRLWTLLEEAGSFSGDRMWRMPLLKHYSEQMTDHEAYDLNNMGKGKGGGSCTAAAFLREFVDKKTPWVHLDIASVMCETSDQRYTSSAMSGRPLRTLVEFIIRESK